MFEDIFIFPAVSIGVSRFDLITRSVCRKLVLCRHENGRISGSGVITFEIGPQKSRDRAFAVVGDVHQQGEVIFLLLVKAKLDLPPGGQTAEGVRAFLKDGGMQVRGFPRLPSEHL